MQHRNKLTVAILVNDFTKNVIQGDITFPEVLAIHSFFYIYIRTSNLGAEAERSYFFWQFEPEVLRCS